MSSVVPKEEDRFYENVQTLSRAIQDCVQRINRAGYNSIKPEELALYTSVLTLVDRNDLIKGFIGRSPNYWDLIHSKKEQFFLDNAGEMFSFLPIEKINAFKQIYSADGKVIPGQLKEQIWDLFHALIKICIKYVHRHRKPTMKDGKPVYAVSFFPEIDLDYHSQKWKVKLVFDAK